MCLIAFDWQPESRDGAHRLALIANRDEFFDRPTAPLHWWQDRELLAGKDLREGGTWMGLTPRGRFAALTNYRSPAEFNPAAKSRGHIASDYLLGDMSSTEFMQSLQHTRADYNGFNLLCGELLNGELWWFSNRSDHAQVQRVPPGLHGLSNALLDTPWPKVQQACSALSNALDKDHPHERHAHLLRVLSDAQTAPDEQLPQTGVPLAWERRLSSRFIPAADLGKGVYGTRSSSVLWLDVKGASWTERTHHGPAILEQSSSTKTEAFQWAY